MTIPIVPAAGMPGITGITGISGIDGLSSTAATGKAGGFGSALSSGLDSVAGLEKAADTAVSSFAAGGSLQITDVMAATAKANLGVTIVNEIRNRGLEAYQSILNVQV